MTPGPRRLPVWGVAVLGWVLGGCVPTGPTPAPPASTAGAPTRSVGLETVPVASQTATPTAATAVAIDRSLLDILPPTVDGLPVVDSPDGEAAALGDPLLSRVASGIAAGFALEPTGGDFVYAVVVRTFPGSMDAAAFRDWRDSYDQGACEQAGGVTGNAETEIGGRTVYIGSCAGGLRTYHLWLVERGVLISASAVGERRLGEVLVSNLRP